MNFMGKNMATKIYTHEFSTPMVNGWGLRLRMHYVCQEPVPGA